MLAKVKHDIAVHNDNYQCGVLTIDLPDGTKIHGIWEAKGGVGRGCTVHVNTTDVEDTEAHALLEAVEEITVRNQEDYPESWVEEAPWEGTVDWDEFRQWAKDEMFDGAGR
jgi:hypothetical protein